MVRKKVPPPATIVMSDEDIHKIASFFQILIAVDRRMRKEKRSRRTASSTRKEREKLGSLRMRDNAQAGLQFSWQLLYPALS